MKMISVCALSSTLMFLSSGVPAMDEESTIVTLVPATQMLDDMKIEPLDRAAIKSALLSAVALLGHRGEEVVQAPPERGIASQAIGQYIAAGDAYWEVRYIEPRTGRLQSVTLVAEKSGLVAVLCNDTKQCAQMREMP